MLGFVARFCLFGLSWDLVRLVLAFAFGCFFFFSVSGVFDSCVDHGARSLVQEVLAFSPTSESGRHARAHDSTSPPYDPERCGHDAAHPGDLESG